MHKYKVSARDWRVEYQKVFGEQYSLHDLNDTEIVNMIMTLGRAEIREEGTGFRSLEFQNDYD